MSKLEGEQRVEELKKIPLWKEQEGRDAITRTFMFKGLLND